MRSLLEVVIGKLFTSCNMVSTVAIVLIFGKFTFEIKRDKIMLLKKFLLKLDLSPLNIQD